MYVYFQKGNEDNLYLHSDTYSRFVFSLSLTNVKFLIQFRTLILQNSYFSLFCDFRRGIRARVSLGFPLGMRFPVNLVWGTLCPGQCWHLPCQLFGGRENRGRNCAFSATMKARHKTSPIKRAFKGRSWKGSARKRINRAWEVDVRFSRTCESVREYAGSIRAQGCRRGM